jgi:cytochrome c-type biogenesis protein CcmE
MAGRETMQQRVVPSQAMAERLAAVARPRSRTAFLRNRKFLALLVVVAVGVGGLIWFAVRSAGMYYMTVGELQAEVQTKGPAAYNQTYRLGAKVVEGSVQQDETTNTLRFLARDDNGNTIPIVYHGVVPDAFKEGGDVVLEGKVGQTGTFEASSLLAKCPSKYKVPGA